MQEQNRVGQVSTRYLEVLAERFTVNFGRDTLVNERLESVFIVDRNRLLRPRRGVRDVVLRRDNPTMSMLRYDHRTERDSEHEAKRE